MICSTRGALKKKAFLGFRCVIKVRSATSINAHISRSGDVCVDRRTDRSLYPCCTCAHKVNITVGHRTKSKLNVHMSEHAVL